MESFYLKELITAVKGKFLIGDPKLSVKNISIDSRTVKKGEVFFAIKGENYDGHNFIGEAVSRGASAIVCSQYDIGLVKPFPSFPAVVKVDDTVIALGDLAKAYRKRFKDIKIVGITGSNGKTTTKEILSSILNTQGKTVSNKGNFNNRIGLPLSILNLTSDVKYGVFELGTSVKGEIKILSDILCPDIAIITNIGCSHLETFVNPEGVYEEKKALLDAIAGWSFAVVNKDDEYLKNAVAAGGAKIISFAIANNADVTAKNISLRSGGQLFELHYGKGFVYVNMPSKGKFNVLNALGASAAALGLGCSLEDVKKGIENFKAPAMRMETIVTKRGVTLINDAYNANPSSVRESINAVLEAYPSSEINLVLGDMLELGENSALYHKELGKFISDKKIKSVYLAGEMSFYTKESAGKKVVFYCGKSSDLFAALKKSGANKKSVFLFKGSRGMKLENTYKKFFEFLENEEK
ncbi:UDP-N-acetylmuramoyl-tripeptide--D-alanyl-D-alanine ligase [Endomicrobium proavitum]|uniref:UDP-N-acetylmuramoyl-tripeptide--D-alanyl-D-alanine ligase n=1 Tax=Endomicrobium proavitum TaxID=1408281 RepID=A0A0G3WGA1_9BACT|nr:UDP-N-acetylmuramoyl-tripeptide--D-alanyl-D-alanine ligase [Endomicrobium proavitum]AKL97676.1 UDP-N-acetylmuramoyl-tripeptide--D-alanyl-D-alanine ligase [Endomicrobium proavitum]